MRGRFALLFLVAIAGPARATPYETFIDIEDQADLDDLLASGDITTDTYEELLELLTTGVDLNTADRAQLYALPNLTYEDVDAIIAYREAQRGVIADPAGLVAAGVITEDKLLAIASFVVVRQADTRLRLRGFVQAMTRYAPSDGTDYDIPPFASRGRFTLMKHLQFGYAATVTRLQVGEPVYDPNRDALIASRPGTQLHVPKIYVEYETDDVQLIGGSFRAGFGQRLVFDNTGRYSVNGFQPDDQLFYSSDLASQCRESGAEIPSPCTGAARYEYVTPDWRWRQALFGVGGGLRRVPVGDGWLQLFGWGSSSRRSIYQYELYNKRTCDDPYDDGDPGCSAPPIFVRPDGDLLDPTTRHSYQTLPNVFRENLAGVNVGYFADRRNSIGLTGFYAKESSLIEGVDLDLQEWSRIPIGGVFGAGGANFTFGRGAIDVLGEVAYSYDKQPDPEGGVEGGGGPAAILRVTHTQKRQEIEGVLRYYGIDYENPYARPISQADELDGSRARDEVGGRIRYTKTDKLYSVRSAADVWTPLLPLRDETVLGDKRAQLKLDTYVRADVRTSHELWTGLWLRYQDKDLSEGGNDECFEISTEENELGETIPCQGRQLTTTARIRYQPTKKLALTGVLEHQLLDDEMLTMGSKYRQDWGAWVIALWHPQPGARVRGRLRYLDESSELLGGDDANLERSLSFVVDTVLRVRSRDSIRVRADGKFYLDDRSSTQDREPNPELQLWLQYEAKL
ncbi:MAG TPA: hypothetical protein VK427_16085 [Kofleriaceae bacterium]|nr:hypothetical protein [Kofleriaceae bacterium]